MKLYFRRNNGEFIFIQDVDGLTVGEIISLFLNYVHTINPKYKSYYQRYWKDENGWTWIDVGSYTEFGVVKKGDINEE